MSVKSYIESNKDRFLEELFSLIRIPSISANMNKPDMLTCAQRWTEVLLSSGADKANVMPTKRQSCRIRRENGISMLDRIGLRSLRRDARRTLELWKSEPFEPVIRDGHLGPWSRR